VPDPNDEPPARADVADSADPTVDVAHELGNRLAAIVAFSHLIRTDPRLPDDLHEQAELLTGEVNRTRQLVEGLLATAATREEPRVERPSHGAATVAAQARILVVDDEPAIRDFLARILARAGYEPIVAADGREALEIVGSDRPPDAILCDHRMAGMSGSAFHDAVAAASPRLVRRFAFMSGDVSDPDLRALADAGGVALLAKPFDIETVEETVGRLLAAPTGGDGPS
jgi:CheY-like chemotaxis protein